MPTPTYTPIWSTTLAANASSIFIGGIPQIYRDLILVSNYNGTTAGDVCAFQLNGDTGSNYSGLAMRGNGSTTYSGTWSGVQGYISQYGGFTSTFESNVTQFLDYATNKHKTILYRSDIADSKSEAGTNRWASTSAITSIKLFTSSGNLASGSTFSLFGIAG